jgi:hypothetical protein
LSRPSVFLTVIDWPALSPDLSPIENVWAMLKRSVSARAPYSAEELARYVTEEFNAIPQSVINKLVGDFERRLRVCVQRKGSTV